MLVDVQAIPVIGGSVTGGGSYVPGSSVVLTAAASNYWQFTGWNDGATNNPYASTAPFTNVTYTAFFSMRYSVGDGIPDWWRAQYFGGEGTTTDGLSCATSELDGEGLNNLQEYCAGTDPTNAAS